MIKPNGNIIYGGNKKAVKIPKNKNLIKINYLIF